MSLNQDFINSISTIDPRLAKLFEDFYKSKEDITPKEAKQLISALETISFKHKENGHRLGFVPGMKVPTGMRVPGQGNYVMQDTALNAASAAASSVLKDMLAGNKPTSRATVMNALRAGSESAFPDIDFKGFMEGPNNPGGGGTSINNSPMANSPYNGQGFIFQPKPLEVRYSPDLPNTIYGEVIPEPFQEATEGAEATPTSANITRSSAHLTQAVLRLPQTNTIAGSTIDNYFDNVFIPTLQLKAQGSVSFNINASINFGNTEMRQYLDTIMDALSIYYFFAHTYGYCSISSNRNPAMFALRELFATSDVQQLQLLEERLMALPIPPRVNELIYWFYNIYREDSLAGSNLIFNIPVGLSNGGANPNDYINALSRPVIIQDQLAALSDPTFIKTTNFLMRVCPEWANTKVGSNIGIVEHDPNFSTVWKNEPLSNAYDDGTAIVVGNVPRVDSNVIDIPYGSLVESLSGGIQSLSSIYQNGVWNGLIGPFPSTTGPSNATNRFSFAVNSLGGSAAGWTDATFNLALQDIRNETSSKTPQSTNPRPYSMRVPAMMVPVLGVNLQANSQIICEFIKYLTSLDQVGTKAYATPDSMKPSMPRRNRKRK